jgi:hypothetical protein
MIHHHFCDRYALREGNSMMRIVHIIKWVSFGIIGAGIFILLFSFLVRLIWNAVIPDIFGLPAITFWQACGLTFLVKILFGGGRWKHFRDIREKHGRYCEMDSNPFYSMHHPSDYEKFWHEEGRAAFEAFMKKKENAEDRKSPE